jgi:hypothetical protein
MKAIVATFALAALIGCAGGDKSASGAADSLSRELELAQPDSGMPLTDVEGATPETVYVSKPTPSAPATAKPKPAAPAPTAPAPKPAAKPAALASGETFTVTATDTVTSRVNKAGETMYAKVGQDITAADGRVVIPAGSTVAILLKEFKSAPTKGGKETVVLQPTSVSIAGTSYPVTGTVDKVTYTLKGRGVTAGTAAKVGAGAAAGALLGKAIGGNTGGAVIGGVVGGAAGAAVADETGDRDVVIAPGAPITIRLTGDFVAAK